MNTTDPCFDLDHDWSNFTRDGWCQRCGAMVIEVIDWDPETGEAWDDFE